MENSDYKKQQILVSRMYYNENMTQLEIAQKLGISRPKVSRILTEARSGGIVRIYIQDTIDTESELENRFKELFGLKNIHIVSVNTNNPTLITPLVAEEAAMQLASLIRPDSVIGVGWGRTLLCIINALPYLNYPESKVVQLCGNIDKAMYANHAHEIVSHLCDKLSSAAYNLPCPAVVDNPLILEMLMHDGKTKSVMQLGADADIMLVNIALVDSSSCLINSDYLTEADIHTLTEKGAVGSICCRYYDISGNPCDSGIDNRTMTVSIDAIKKCGCAMTCVADSRRAGALLGALNGGMLDILVVDSITAAEVMRLHDNMQ